VQDRDVVTTDR